MAQKTHWFYENLLKICSVPMQGQRFGVDGQASCSQGASSLVGEAECQGVMTLQGSKDIPKCVKHGGDKLTDMVPRNTILRCSLCQWRQKAQGPLMNVSIFICVLANEPALTYSPPWLSLSSVIILWSFIQANSLASVQVNHESQRMHLTLCSVTHMHSRTKSWRGRGSLGFAEHRDGLGGCVCQTGGH